MLCRSVYIINEGATINNLDVEEMDKLKIKIPLSEKTFTDPSPWGNNSKGFPKKKSKGTSRLKN